MRAGVVRQEPKVDFQNAFNAGLEGVKDSEVLAIAARQGRVLVSHDRKTMPSEFALVYYQQSECRSHYRFSKATNRTCY